MRDHKEMLVPLLMDPTVEGLVPHYYCDVRGHVTMGVGHLVRRAEAEREGLLDDWQACKAFYKRQPNSKAHLYGAVTERRFSLEEVMRTLVTDIRETDRLLVALIPGYAHAPTGMALMALELAFHLGASRVRLKYPRFQAALHRGDWQAALGEIGRGAKYKQRVAVIRGAVHILCHGQWAWQSNHETVTGSA